MSENKDSFSLKQLLNILSPEPKAVDTLKDIFEGRLEGLKISLSNAAKLLSMERRTLNGILNGSQKTIDYSNLIKISNFLQISKEETIKLYLLELEKNFPDRPDISSDKIAFIKENFDLVALKKVGFIESITNFYSIEQKIVNYFGLKQITDYKRHHNKDVAFSSAAVATYKAVNRDMWINSAIESFVDLNNIYPYNRDALIKFFPEIRWHSTNVEYGLANIIRDLFKMGISVIYQDTLPSVHVRGATFDVNSKPCIVLTDYRGLYPTLWFALVHELFHVLFDYEEVINKEYHLSIEDSKDVRTIEKEKEANSFAREYLFSVEKTERVRSNIYNHAYVSNFAKENHVHPSFIYVFNAYDQGHRAAWALANKHKPNFEDLKKTLNNPWDNTKPIAEHIKFLRNKFF